MASAADGSWADRIVDQVLPEELDWRAKVRAYPLSSMAIVAIAGFVLGRVRGDVLSGAVSAYAMREVTRNLTGVLDREDPG